MSLLQHAPRLTLLATSRAVLHLSGEHVYPVRPLPSADASALFRQRARAADSTVDLTERDADAVAQICELLDRLPLAIEPAASRTRILSPRELLLRLEPRLPLLTGGLHDLPAHQRTMSAAIAWSHELLDEPARREFRRLAVFAAGCTLDAARAICDSSLEAMSILLDNTLVQRSPTPADHAIGCSRPSASMRPSSCAKPESSGMSAPGTCATSSTSLSAATFTPRLNCRRTSKPQIRNRKTSAPPVARPKRWETSKRPSATTVRVVTFRRAWRREGDRDPRLAPRDHRAGPWRQHSGGWAARAQSCQISRHWFATRRGANDGRACTVARARGDRRTAARLFQESAAMCEQIGRSWWQARMLAEVGKLALADGELDVATARSIGLLELAVHIGDRERTLLGLAYIACAAARTGHLERAGRIYSVLETERDHGSDRTIPADDTAHIADILTRADPLLEQGRQQGKGLSLQHAIDEALGHRAGRQRR